MTKFDVPRKRLREMGVPEDMSADDVVAFFSLPDDDLMHQQCPVGPGWALSNPCPVCGALGPWFENPLIGECVSNSNGVWRT
jgi:hypothetical protein